MSNVLVQFRTADTAKAKATNNGIPFSMNINDLPNNRGLSAMKEASKIASENGIADMTLDEINAEINAARKQVSE